MDPSNQNSVAPVENNAEPPPVQPRQPADLRGLMRFAMEAQGDNEPVAVAPLANDRREFLEQALQSMVIDARELLQITLPILKDKEKIGSLAGKEEVSEEVTKAFDNLLDFIENIDNADAFCKSGGFEVFELHYNTQNYELWVLTNDLLAGVCQNYCPGQALALEHGLLKTLLDKLKHNDTKHKEKFIYALSSCVREFPASSQALIAMGGVEALAPLLQDSGQAARTKAACLLNHLTRHYQSAKDKLKQLNLPKLLASAIDTNIGDSTEHLLNLLRAYVDKKEPDIIQQCRNVDPSLKDVISSVLSSPSVKNDREQYREVIEYGLEIISFVFGEGTPLCDCSDEADR